MLLTSFVPKFNCHMKHYTEECNILNYWIKGWRQEPSSEEINYQLLQSPLQNISNFTETKKKKIKNKSTNKLGSVCYIFISVLFTKFWSLLLAINLSSILPMTPKSASYLQAKSLVVYTGIVPVPRYFTAVPHTDIERRGKSRCNRDFKLGPSPRICCFKTSTDSRWNSIDVSSFDLSLW